MKRYHCHSHGRTVRVEQPAMFAEDLVLVQETAPSVTTSSTPTDNGSDREPEAPTLF